MGKIPQGILGGVSGKIGGVVGSSWKGINVVKTKPLSVANPKTAGQVAQRTKFSNTVAFAQIILSTVIKPLWDRFASKQSGYNAFIQTNLALFTNALPNPENELVISKGKMSATPIDAVLAGAGGKDVDLEWINDSGQGFKLATDIAYVVVVNETKNEIKGFETVNTRVETQLSVTMEETIEAGDVIHAYLAFKRADGTVVSNTSYNTVVSA